MSADSADGVLTREIGQREKFVERDVDERDWSTREICWWEIRWGLMTVKVFLKRRIVSARAVLSTIRQLCKFDVVKVKVKQVWSRLKGIQADLLWISHRVTSISCSARAVFSTMFSTTRRLVGVLGVLGNIVDSLVDNSFVDSSEEGL